MAENVEFTWVDSHCHWDFEVFDQDRSELWRHILACGGRGLIIPGVKANQWPSLLNLCEGQPWFPALGIHPYFLSDFNPEHLQQLAALLEKHNPIAVGEIGLDFALPEQTQVLQQQVFEQQLRLADDYRLPIILHAHKAYDQVLAAVKASGFSHGGIVHGFSGSEQQAQRLLEAGLIIGIGGVISRPNAQRLRALVAGLPAHGWVLETDAPDMTPAFWATKRNDPRSLLLLAQQVASLRGTSLKQTLGQHMATLLALFPALRNLPNL